MEDTVLMFQNRYLLYRPSSKKTNLIIIDQHIRHCVKQAFAEGNEDEKVREIIELIDKYAK